jgi:tRNA (guanine37-N1)-methyltransferase
MDMEVPPVLLSGNHEEIRKWRRKEAIKKTIFKRPDLMNRFTPTDEDRKLIREVMEEIPE